MASTSLVFSLRAMTVGSFSTMPRPRAYTSVLAVPRSMARSLASPVLLARIAVGAAPVAPSLGGEGLQLAVEGVDAGLDRRGLAIPQEDHEPADDAHHHHRREVEQVGHQPRFPAWSRSPISRTSCADA